MNIHHYLFAWALAIWSTTWCSKAPTSTKDLRENILSSVNHSLQDQEYQLQDWDLCDILVAEDRIGILCKGKGTISPIVSVPNSKKVTWNIGVQNVTVSKDLLDVNSWELFEYSETSGQRI